MKPRTPLKHPVPCNFNTRKMFPSLFQSDGSRSNIAVNKARLNTLVSSQPKKLTVRRTNRQTIMNVNVRLLFSTLSFKIEGMNQSVTKVDRSLNLKER